jgi:phage terminase small subunit
MTAKKKSAKKKAAKPKITAAHRQKLFPKKYVECMFNGARAAEACGYSKKTSRQAATRLLADVEIRAAVNREVEALAGKIEATELQIICEMMKLAFSDIGDYVDIGPEGIRIRSMKDLDTSVIQDVSETYNMRTGNRIIRFRMHSKDKALEMLGKVKAMFTENIKDVTPTQGPDLSGLSRGQLMKIRNLQQEILGIIGKDNDETNS